jgi:hypothetical protein
MANSIKKRESVKKSMKESHIFSTIREEDSKPSKEEFMKSSIIKSTCDGEQLTLSSCMRALGNDKFFLNLF